MRYLLTSLLCVLTLSLTAQVDCPNTYDGDGDGAIGVGDLLGLLALFGDADMDSDGVWDSVDECIDDTACNYQSNPTEPCDDLDVLGVCGGTCAADIDGNGICDPTPITNDNIHVAVDLWQSDEVSAETTYGHISDWDVSSVTNMSQLFYLANSFNDDISSWDVSSVSNMYEMFQDATSFNGDLSSWDVSSVTNMQDLFENASSFNGDLSSWDVSSVTNMKDLFERASSFNGDISSWDVSNVTDMSGMFYNNSYFNGDISSWDVSNVTDMSGMFYNNSYFNGDLSSWDVSSVQNMEAMFFEAQSFNGDISSWDVSSVTNMSSMFFDNYNFNSDISSWDVSSVTNMSSMFQFAYDFNSDISSWNVSSATNMSFMFDGASALSEENQCAIHTSFSSNTAWSYDWSGYCPVVCGDLVSHEGYDYSTVLIGDQCWFAENCRYLPSVSPSSEGSGTSPYYYVYDYQDSDVTAAKATDNYETYGVLYNWPAVMTDSICPSGWHIPSDGEFTQLTNFLGGETVAGGKIKEAGYDHWNSPNYGATNSSGFTGLPGSYCNFYFGFGQEGNSGYLWSSSAPGYYPWKRDLLNSNDSFYRYNADSFMGYSARCVRD